VDYDKFLSDHTALLNYIAAGTGRRDIVFGELVTVEDWKPKPRMTGSFSNGRVLIVGDAAHTHYTSGGQGVTSGVTDSMNLAWKLALVDHGLSPRTLLSTYNEERLPVITEMVDFTTRLFDKLFKNDYSKSTITPDIRQLGVNYRRSSLVIDDAFIDAPDSVAPVRPYGAARLDVHAGDRAPDAPGLYEAATGKTWSLFSLFTSYQHTALIFAGTDGGAAPFLDTLRVSPPGTIHTVVLLPKSTQLRAPIDSDGLVLFDSDGHAYHAYVRNKYSSVAVVIRPDGIVGVYTQSTKRLEEYMGRIFAL